MLKPSQRSTATNLRLISLLLFIVFLTIPEMVIAQTGSVKGRIYNRINNEAVPFANVVIEGTTTGVVSDIDGNYRLDGLEPGIYTLVCSFVGFEQVTINEVSVSPSKPVILDIALSETANKLDEVVIEASPFEILPESPVSVREISATEILRNPGSNRDISNVVRSLPGVASSVSFRNDLIVRGGAPNENRFYLDGIEVPNINHFATQGSSGGPVGMINVNFIRDVNFYAGAFPVNRGNALSSVMEFKQISGNDERFSGSFMVGSSDIGLTLEGPTGENSAFIFSARRSYLQFLFQALKLPFLPTYNDFQYKHDFRINDKNKITLIGLGAIDDFALNEKVNDGVTDPEVIERNDYILGNLPINTQWNYAVGAKWTHFSKNSYQETVVSRNHLQNKSFKYQDNIQIPENLILDYVSEEIENKVRFEHHLDQNGWNVMAGVGYEHVLYKNSTFQRRPAGGTVVTLDYNSVLRFNKYALFAQASRSLLGNKLTLSAGIRTDFNDYSDEMANPLDQLSPRFSASYLITPKFAFNFNVGRFSQLPPYTVLGYRNTNEDLVNRDNGVKYIHNNHIVAGFEYKPNLYAKISLEGFYKVYQNYPFLIADSVSLANLGGDFGVIGNEPATSISEGRSYGIEVLAQQRLADKIYGIFSYTFVKSEFTDKNGEYVPSSWDNGHILNMTVGRKFVNNWEVGMKFRLQGGPPYTPIDVATSSLKEVWDVTGQGIPDYNRLNTERLPLSHGLDIRVDKTWYLGRMTLNVYFDIQNVYNFQNENPPFLNVVKDANGLPIEDPNNPDAYLTKQVSNVSGTVLPSVGILWMF
jgi:hypothetical protein